jgi:hypothetical protein
MTDHPANCMARTIVSKAAFARLMNRTGPCVSHWIKTGRISPASLVGSGRNARIWRERAEADLAANLDPVQQSLQQYPLRGLDDHEATRDIAPAARDVSSCEAMSSGGNVNVGSQRRGKHHGQ